MTIRVELNPEMMRAMPKRERAIRQPRGRASGVTCLNMPYLSTCSSSIAAIPMSPA